MNKMGFEFKVFLAVGLMSVSAMAEVHKVKITGFMSFEPAAIEVLEGDTIEFINESRGRHTVTADASMVKDVNNVLLPEGAEPFHSGVIDPGRLFSQTFTVAGEYKYVCLPHELMGMTGSVMVVAAP